MVLKAQPNIKLDLEAALRHLKKLRDQEQQESVYDDLTLQINGIEKFMRIHSFSVL